MDAEATAALHKRGILATDDSFKFIWFQVNIQIVIRELFKILLIWCLSW